MQDKILLTVFTPSYNRIHTLSRTYESLKKQTCKQFVWLIVDDGSTDETSQTVHAWQGEENGFEIRYIYKQNGGMHTAHNTAYDNIDTELNVCIDSDDAMPENAVENILKSWKADKSDSVAGIMGLDSDFHGNIIGKGFPAGLTHSTVSGYYSAGGSGDKKLVYRTDLMKALPPYPVFDGEKYFSLSYKYLLCDQKYTMIILPEVLCLVDYQQDGSSKNMLRQYIRNPKGFAEWRKIKMRYDTSKKRLIKDCIHYCSSCLIAGNRRFVRESPQKLLTVLCIPAGWLLKSYILLKTRENK